LFIVVVVVVVVVVDDDDDDDVIPIVVVPIVFVPVVVIPIVVVPIVLILLLFLLLLSLLLLFLLLLLLLLFLLLLLEASVHAQDDSLDLSYPHWIGYDPTNTMLLCSDTVHNELCQIFLDEKREKQRCSFLPKKKGVIDWLEFF
jgi:hypothetical protein